MVADSHEAAVTYRRLSELRERYNAILQDSNKSERVKAMELAGLRSLIEQLETEL